MEDCHASIPELVGVLGFGFLRALGCGLWDFRVWGFGVFSAFKGHCGLWVFRLEGLGLSRFYGLVALSTGLARGMI